MPWVGGRPPGLRGRALDALSGIIRAVSQAKASQTPAEEPAHDVLAAEAFAVPGPDPELAHGPVTLPEDPTGIQAPHDILAAEEFAMPAVMPHQGEAAASRARLRRRLTVAGAIFALALGCAKLLHRVTHR